MDALDIFPNTTSILPLPSGPRDLLTWRQFVLFMEISVVVRITICIVGLITNALNIRAFYRLGLTESTIVFFCLALSDFIHLFGGLIGSFLNVALILETQLNIHMKFPPGILDVLVFIPLRGFSEITYLSTTFLAVQRCLCVAKPLHFKGMFTRFRTVFIMIVIWLFSLTFAFTLLGHWCRFKTITLENNSTKIVFDFIPGREELTETYTTIFMIGFNTTNQLTVTVCVFVMAHALNNSVRFRQKSSASGSTPNSASTHASAPISASSTTFSGTMSQDQKFGPDKSENAPKKAPFPDNRNRASCNDRNKPTVITPAGTHREKHAIIQVSLVCLIFLICNSVRMVFAFSSLAIPHFDIYGPLQNTYNTIYITVIMFEYFNSTVNFFIYYKYNSKFKSVCFLK